MNPAATRTSFVCRMAAASQRHNLSRSGLSRRALSVRATTMPTLSTKKTAVAMATSHPHKTSSRHEVSCACSSCQRFQVRSYSVTRSCRGVSITYIQADGTSHTVEAEIGKNLLDVAHENNIELEGACGGELACSTCHLVFEQDVYDRLSPKEDEEEDMLDLAYEVTETSRLGCQIIVREDFEGMTVRIPDDGF